MFHAPTILSVAEWQATGGPNYVNVYGWRQQVLRAVSQSPELMVGMFEWYRTRPADFVNHWVDTFDPRNAGRKGMLVRMPLVMFQRQAELIDFFESLKEDQSDGLLEKARAMGATWTACGYSVHQWIFVPGSAIGWGSRKEQLVDKLGDMDSIFEKLRTIIRGLPRIFWPKGFNPKEHMTFMRIVNPENAASITGEAGDNIGRGGRKQMYFKDESAHYERPELIEASLSENTRVQVDISSVNGTANVFYRKREAGQLWQKGKKLPAGVTRVFVMDWSDNPMLTREWYETRKAKFERDGLGHIFAQEVDRDYQSSVLGTIIPAKWLQACIDAHIRLMIHPDAGEHVAGLDVADGGIDRNALVRRRGVVMRECHEWGSTPDPGVSTRMTINHIGLLPSGERIIVFYDVNGVGVGVKTEYNRLLIDKKLPLNKAGNPIITFVPWNAGAKVRNPKYRLIVGDKDSPKNEDYFQNMKAQAWHSMRQRVWKTWRAVTEGAVFPLDELISFDSRMPLLHQLLKELAQPVFIQSTHLKMLVDKVPDGAKSPNLGDAAVICYFPIEPPGARAISGKSHGKR